MLLTLVERAIAAGASEMEVEYKDGWEEVCAVGSGIGVGIARFESNSAEARALRKTLYAIPKKGQVAHIRGCAYLLRVRVYENFGEDAFHLTMTRS